MNSRDGADLTPPPELIVIPPHPGGCAIIHFSQAERTPRQCPPEKIPSASPSARAARPHPRRSSTGDSPTSSPSACRPASPPTPNSASTTAKWTSSWKNPARTKSTWRRNSPPSPRPRSTPSSASPAALRQAPDPCRRDLLFRRLSQAPRRRKRRAAGIRPAGPGQRRVVPGAGAHRRRARRHPRRTRQAPRLRKRNRKRHLSRQGRLEKIRRKNEGTGGPLRRGVENRTPPAGMRLTYKALTTA